jgi:Putative polyhydroxyalkanoic acid system protein (PHA_gran_rgn)
MSNPLVITISHQLSRQEARGRLQKNMDGIRSHLSRYASEVDNQWTEDRMDFRVVAVGQTVTGRIDVLDDAVRVEVHLPWLLARLGTRIGDRIRQQGRTMLTKK